LIVLTAKANTVLYDNLTLKKISGKLIVKTRVNHGQRKNIYFGGTMGLNGAVSTKEKHQHSQWI
jgi:hypothetical protein